MRLRAIVWAGMALLAAPEAWAFQSPPEGWSARLPGIENHYGGGSASDGTYLYRFGGSNSIVPVNPGTVQSSMHRFDPVANLWSVLTPMPVSTTYNRGAFGGGDRIYSFGGWPLADGPIYRYSISADTWTRAGSLTPGLQYYQMAVGHLNGRIHLAGGYTSFGATDAHYEFTIASETLTTRPSLPQPLYDAASAVLGGRFWVIGGIFGSSLQTCYAFDAGAGSWATRAPMSEGGTANLRWGIRAFVARNRIYVCGGYDNTAVGANFGPTTRVLEYSPATNVWAARSPMLVPRYGHVAEAVNGRGFAAGGPDNSCEEYVPPSFGAPPDPPSEVRQLVGGTEVQQGGWLGRQVTFSARLSDPDAGEQVSWEIQVKTSTANWPATATATTGPRPQGPVTIDWTVPAENDYDWRYRVVDAAGNETPDGQGGPPVWTEFRENTVTPDFRSDQTPPGVPGPLAPAGTAQVSGPEGGPVEFSWTAASDSGMGSVTYELHVARDPSGAAEVAAVSGLQETSATIDLQPAEQPYYWYVRAVDGAGNAGPWSDVVEFFVAFRDGRNHAAGDASRVCGFAAGPGKGAGPIGILAALFAGICFRRLAWIR